jgi:hypothetical protein
VFLPYTDIETNILFFDKSKPCDRILYYRLLPPDDRKQYSKTQPLRFEELGECMRILRDRSDDSPNAWFVDRAQILSDERCNLDINNPKVVRSTGEDPRDVAGKLAAALGELSTSMQRATSALDQIRSLVVDVSEWVDVSLGDVLTRRKDAVEVLDGEIYKRLRIQVKGRGVVVRDEVDGAKIGTKRQFRVEAGQFVLSKIDARNGAFGIIPDEGDDAIITGNFWAYDVDACRLLPRLLHYLTRSDAFIQFCTDSSPGATNRRYLQEDLFLAQKVRVPPTEEAQHALCEGLAAVEEVVRSHERDLILLSKRTPVLLQSALHEVFGGVSRRVDDDGESADESNGARDEE